MDNKNTHKSSHSDTAFHKSYNKMNNFKAFHTPIGKLILTIMLNQSSYMSSYEAEGEHKAAFAYLYYSSCKYVITPTDGLYLQDRTYNSLNTTLSAFNLNAQRF